MKYFSISGTSGKAYEISQKLYRRRFRVCATSGARTQKLLALSGGVGVEDIVPCC